MYFCMCSHKFTLKPNVCVCDFCAVRHRQFSVYYNYELIYVYNNIYFVSGIKTVDEMQ